MQTRRERGERKVDNILFHRSEVQYDRRREGSDEYKYNLEDKDDDSDISNGGSLESESEQVQFTTDQEEKETNIVSDVVQKAIDTDDNSSEYALDLRDKKLTRMELGSLTRLRSIDLSFNPISKIEGLDRVPDLRELKLIGCRLNSIENLDRCCKLERLILRGNRIRSISDCITSLKNLRMLDLEGNRIDCISNLHCCSFLAHLNLSMNNLTKITGLETLLMLDYINLSDNKLCQLHGLKKNKNVTVLDLSGNQITDLEGLGGLRKMITLHLERNKLATLKSFPRLIALEELYLEDNCISDLGLLHANAQRLQILDLKNNKIENSQSLELLNEIPRLEEMFLEGNKVCDEKMYLQEVRRFIPSLQVLDLVDITDPAVKLRPTTAGGYRPSTPSRGHNLNIKEAIPLIRPSTAREGGAKRVVPIADTEELASLFKTKISAFRKELSHIPLIPSLKPQMSSSTDRNEDDDGKIQNETPKEEVKIETLNSKRLRKAEKFSFITKKHLDRGNLSNSRKKNLSHSPITVSRKGIERSDAKKEKIFNREDVLTSKNSKDKVVILGAHATPAVPVAGADDCNSDRRARASPTTTLLPDPTMNSTSSATSTEVSASTQHDEIFDKPEGHEMLAVNVVPQAARRNAPSKVERQGYSKFVVPSRVKEIIEQEEAGSRKK